MQFYVDILGWVVIISSVLLGMLQIDFFARMDEREKIVQAINRQERLKQWMWRNVRPERKDK